MMNKIILLLSVLFLNLSMVCYSAEHEESGAKSGNKILTVKEEEAKKEAEAAAERARQTQMILEQYRERYYPLPQSPSASNPVPY
jgi:hypothetical protein